MYLRFLIDRNDTHKCKNMKRNIPKEKDYTEVVVN